MREFQATRLSCVSVRRGRPLWLLGCALALALVAARPAAAQFRELLSKAPKSANAVVLLNVAKAVDSPMGIREGWKKKIEKSFEAGLVRVPPLATNYIVASQLDLEFLEPIDPPSRAL